MKKDEMNLFAKLAKEARGESLLPASVADRVIDTLHARQDLATSPEKVDWFFSFGSFIAACAAMVFFFLGTREDTLFAFEQLFAMVLP